MAAGSRASACSSRRRPTPRRRCSPTTASESTWSSPATACATRYPSGSPAAPRATHTRACGVPISSAKPCSDQGSTRAAAAIRARAGASSARAPSIRGAAASLARGTQLVGLHLAGEALAREADRLRGARDVPAVLLEPRQQEAPLELVARLVERDAAHLGRARAGAQLLGQVLRADARPRRHQHQAL